MTRLEAWLVHVSHLLVGGTGLVYAWMIYLTEAPGEFAVVNHPWQPHLQHLHLLTAPLLVFACGMVWRCHVWQRVRGGFPDRRLTGLFLFGGFVPMAASGYLLQVSVAPGWRSAWGWIHLAVSVLWAAVYLLHQLSPRTARPSGVSR